MSKFTDTEELEIVNKYNLEVPLTKIAKEYKCNNITIKYILAKYKIYKVNLSINVKSLIVDYNNNVSLTEMEKKYKIRRQDIAMALMYEGYDIINKWNKVKFDEHIFDVIDTEEKAYWLGFIYADGYIAAIPKNRKPHYTFELSLKGDDYLHLEKFRRFIKYNGPGKVTISNVSCNNKVCKRCRFSVTNKYFWTTLYKKGCVPNKSLILTFPSINMFKDIKLIWSFVRGYFDGDGSLGFLKGTKSVSPNISILGTKEFLETMKDTLDIPARIYKQKRYQHNTWTMYFNKESSLNFLDKIYNNSSIYLDRKYNRYLFFKTTCHSLKEFNEFFGQKR